MGQTLSSSCDETRLPTQANEEKKPSPSPSEQTMAIDPNQQKELDDALSTAAKRGDTAHVTSLLSQGADLESIDQYKFTPLLNAVYMRQIPTVKLLLERGANPQVKCGMGLRTPLRLPAEHGDEEMVKVLLEHGADPNFYDDNGRTPLVFAAAEGHLGVVKVLLEGGADPEPKSLADRGDSETPLWWAVRHKHEEIAEVLRPLCKAQPDDVVIPSGE